MQRCGKDTVEKGVELHISGKEPISSYSQGVLLTMAKGERLWALTWPAVSSPERGHSLWAKAGF